MKLLLRLWWALIRFGFRLLYNELAWTYDLVSRVVSLGQWRTWQRASIPHLRDAPPGPVLELAHGTGNLQIDLAQAGLEAVGLDLSPAMGRIARRKLRRHGVPARLVRGSALCLPFRDGQFSALVSTFPTEFIVQPATLAEARRVLQPGGRLVVVLNGVLVRRDVAARFLEWLYRITGQRGPWPADPLRAVHEAGFEVAIIEQDIPGSQVTLAVATRLPDGDPGQSAV